jgi:hypothetical protein
LTKDFEMTAPTDSPGNKALRVTFRVDGDKIEVIDQERLKMVVPPSNEFESDTPRSGFWLEVQDRRRRPVYRRVMSNPLTKQVEVWTGSPDQPLANQTVAQPSGIFSIVVPDVPEGRSLVFVGSRPDPGAPRKLRAHQRAFKAKEIARFSIHKER